MKLCRYAPAGGLDAEARGASRDQPGEIHRALIGTTVRSVRPALRVVALFPPHLHNRIYRILVVDLAGPQLEVDGYNIAVSVAVDRLLTSSLGRLLLWLQVRTSAGCIAYSSDIFAKASHHLLLQMIDFVSKRMNFVLRMIIFVSNMMNFVLKMII